MRCFTLIVGTIAALLPLLTAGTMTAQPERAPYLYYFSPERHAFVVERADGTDGFLIGQGIIPINAVAAYGWWSPSGTYFAWQTSRRWLKYVGSRTQGEAEEASGILRADGTPVEGVLPAGEWRDGILWSPADDVFMLPLQTGYWYPLDFVLIDPANDTTLGQFSLRRPGEDVFRSHSVWTTDGEWFVLTFMYGIRENGGYEQYDAILAVSRTGEIREVPIECPGRCDHEKEIPAVSSRNEVLFIDPATGAWTVYDLDTGVSVPIEAPENVGYIDAYWSPDGLSALLLGGQKTWLLDVAQRRISEIGGRSFADEFSPFEPWSPDGRYAAWIGLHSTVSVWDSTSGERHDFPLDSAFKLIWSNDSRTIFVGITDWPGEVVVIDVTTMLPVPESIHAKDAQPSPDNIHWGLFTGSDGKADVLNLETGSIEMYAPHEIHAMTPNPGLYEAEWLWSDDGTWFIVGQTAFWSGGGAGPLAITVYRLGQPQGRDLAFDSGNVKWLPDAAAEQLGLMP